MTATFSTCHVCQIPVTQCVSVSQNDFTNINDENITERDPTRLQTSTDRGRLGYIRIVADLDPEFGQL